MRRIFLAITVLYFLQLAYGQEVCHVGSSHRQTVRTNCRHGGCAVVSYKNTGGQGIAEYKCLTDINHPAFVTLACEHSTVDATCFDQYSNKELPINIRRLQVRERTFWRAFERTSN
ncbi:hypothetical protein M3Y97_00952400 [Aphelenchoides bicaudatus]|nr:hypothetical protein M3Y97_00952400 [Aphelenchoides bicaudatus]